MKLITHNLLMCNKKGCTQNNFPLKIVANKVQEFEGEQGIEYSKGLMTRLAEKLDWPALRLTINSVIHLDSYLFPFIVRLDE
jgi:hypothetical protein